MKKILCIVLALMLTLSLAACGGAGMGGSSEVGKYYFQSMESGGMSVDREMFTSLMGVSDEELDEYMFIEITAPGKATMISAGETAEMAYDSTSMWPVEEPDEKANCTVGSGKITLEIEGSKVIFVKK